MNQKLKLLPLDKKILKACAILEIKNQTDFVEEFLRDRFFQLNDDSKSIYLALVNRYRKEIPVGNYGGLYVGLGELYQDLGIEKSLLVDEQLLKRELWREDKHSSKKWSARILLDDPKASFKLGNYFVDLADKVRRSWNDKTKIKKLMKRPDENIKAVMNFYWNGIDFSPNNSETAVSKAILDEKTTSNLILENPQWINHESDRTKSIHQTLREYHSKKPITTDDPRVVMSIVLKGKIENQEVKLKNYSCISKIFPSFWECL